MPDVRQTSCLRNASTPVCWPNFRLPSQEECISTAAGYFTSTPKTNIEDYMITKSLSHKVCLSARFPLYDVFRDKPLRMRTEQCYFTLLIVIQLY